jgi:hypothetical protein
MRRRAGIVVLMWLTACGPEARGESPEERPWMTGVWSAVLLTEENTDREFGLINDPGNPLKYEIFGDGTYEITSADYDTPSGRIAGYETRSGTWELVAEHEIIITSLTSSGEVAKSRWKPVTGERGCDALSSSWIHDSGDGEPFYFYRGAVCTFQPSLSCPVDALPWDSCRNWIYTWCEDQGTNEPWREDDWSPNRYCHLPGYEEEED